MSDEAEGAVGLDGAAVIAERVGDNRAANAIRAYRQKMDDRRLAAEAKATDGARAAALTSSASPTPQADGK